MKIGAVKLGAVIFEIGVNDNALKNINNAAILITPLNACKSICLLRRIANEERNRSDLRKAKPKILWKKTI